MMRQVLKDVRLFVIFFFFQAEDGIRDDLVTGVQTCALPILVASRGRDVKPGFIASIIFPSIAAKMYERFTFSFITKDLFNCNS